MKRKTLSYYPKFQCIADKCRHSCCLGWEIDIDPDTREHYATLKDPYAKTINDNIEDDPEPHFRLTSDERCPFLNSRGLCDMILNIGEEHLCNICRDHPRYRNNGEIGLGICCEEALRLLIEETDPITEIEVEDDYCNDDDELVFEYEVQRKELFDILNSDADFEEKINRCSDYMGCGLEFDPEWSKKLLWELERMEDSWEDRLGSIGTLTLKMSRSENKIFSNLLIYFIHRYFPQSYDDYSLVKMWVFCEFSVFTIMSIFQNSDRTIEGLSETARLFSSEIEYSDQNIDIILDNLLPDIS